MPAGTVEVFLIGATGIKDTEIFGKADPYAVLTCGRQKLRSNTASNQGAKPIWNQKLSFYIDDSTTDLQIRIYNHNILKDDDELGSTVIPLAKSFSEGKLPTTSYNVVRPSGRVQGEIKLSISFTAKNKAGPQSPQSISGPYNNSQHASPYGAIPPEPKVKHDPLIGPQGYFRKGSSLSDSSVGGSSHSGHYSYASDSEQGNDRPYPPSETNAPLQGVYPPVSPVNEPVSPYHRMDSNCSFHSSDSFSRFKPASSPGGSYPVPPISPDYTGSSYQRPPYEHGPYPIPPLVVSEASSHGPLRVSSALSAYPTPGVHNSFSSIPSANASSHGGVAHYRVDDLTGNFAGLNVSGTGSESSSHENHAGYQRVQSSLNGMRPSGYPPINSSSHGNYPGYSPVANVSNDRPTSGYSTSGHPPAGYPSSPYDGYGRVSSPGSYSSSYGQQSPPPPSSYYPAHLAIPDRPYGRVESGHLSPCPSSCNAYPPVPYYDAPPAHYVPAGYPK